MNRYYKSQIKYLQAGVSFILSLPLLLFCAYSIYTYFYSKEFTIIFLLAIPIAFFIINLAIISLIQANKLYKPYKELFKKRIFISCDCWELVPVGGKDTLAYLEIFYEDLKFISEPFNVNEKNLKPTDYIRVYVNIEENPNIYYVDVFETR